MKEIKKNETYKAFEWILYPESAVVRSTACSFEEDVT